MRIDAARETEFRRVAFPNGVWERGKTGMHRVRWVETLRRQGNGRSTSNANSFNAFLGLAASQARLDKSSKQRMCLRRLRFELRVTLDCQEPGMALELDYFHQLAVRTGAGNDEAVGRQLLQVAIIQFITMTVPFFDAQLAVSLMSLA